MYFLFDFCAKQRARGNFAQTHTKIYMCISYYKQSYVKDFYSAPPFYCPPFSRKTRLPPWIFEVSIAFLSLNVIIRHTPAAYHCPPRSFWPNTCTVEPENTGPWQNRNPVNTGRFVRFLIQYFFVRNHWENRKPEKTGRLSWSRDRPVFSGSTVIIFTCIFTSQTTATGRSI